MLTEPIGMSVSVKTDGILMARQVGRPQQYVDGLNGGRDALLEVGDAKNVEINVVIDIDKMQCGKG